MYASFELQVDVWSVGIIFYQCLYGKKVSDVLLKTFPLDRVTLFFGLAMFGSLFTLCMK